MKDQIDCRLASGEYLRFTRFKDGRPLSPMGGNFVYVAEEDEGFRVIFAGQTDNLAMHAGARWAEAQAKHGAEAIYTRLNITTAVRRREHAQLLQALEPPMNSDELRPAGAHDTPDGDGASAAGF